METTDRPPRQYKGNILLLAAIGPGGVSLTRRPACGLLACCDSHLHLDVSIAAGASRPCAPTCFQVM